MNDEATTCRRMNREAVLAWKRGLEMAGEREAAELRVTPIGMKLRQMTALLQAAERWGWPERTPMKIAEVERVRRRWARLRMAAGV